MHPKNVLPNPFYFRFSLRVLFITCFILVSLLSLIRVETAHACTSSTAAATDPCVAANCVKAGIGNNGNCLKLITDCSTFTGPGSNGSNTIANCSNALASCFTSEIDTTGCKDNGVLSRVTVCNQGNVDAAGSCGVDQAIDDRNANSGGTDFATNKGIMQARTDQLNQNCQNQNGFTIQQVQTCKDNLMKDNADCNAQLGGQAAQISQQAYNNCMASKANNPGDCAALGGTFDQAANKCNPPANAAPPGSTPGQGAAPAQPGTPVTSASVGTGTGTCGQAKTNIIKNCGNGKGLPILVKVLQFALSALTMIVGIAAVGGLAWAALMYARAGDNEGTTKEAKDLIRNVVIGIVLYGFMIAIIDWLVPGAGI